VQPLAYKAARTLAMRLAVERDIEALDVDTIDDFLDTTRHWPWLIVHGVTLIEAIGIQGALDSLAMLDLQAADPVSSFLIQRFQSLAAEAENPLLLLVRAQGLADAFDEGLAQVLGGRPDQIGRLVQNGLLCRDEGWFAMPDAARAFLHARSPLRPELQDQVDQEVMKYLARTWPYQGDAPILMDRPMRARLNNLRAAIQRQLRPDIGIDLRVLSRVLVVAERAFATAGLGEEFLAYAQGFRERLPEGTDLARLQMAMGETLSLLPDQEGEAGWAFQMSLRLDDLDTATRAQVCRALGRHLIRVDQVDAAEEFLSDSLRSLLAQVRRGDVTLAASLAHEWANALVLLGQSTDAVRRFEAALAGYAESQDAAQSAVAQRDLSSALIALGDMDRAEDVLRRALVTADYVGRRDLAEDIRRRLAHVHVTRADAEHQAGQRGPERDELLAAEAYLSDALVDAQARGDSRAMAAIHLEVGRILGRLGRPDDAVLHAVRGRSLSERSGSLPDRVAAAITSGQLHMLHGDSVTAQHILHEALDRAAALGDEGLIAQAAGVLLQIHQIRARHAPQAGRDFRQYTLDQASSTRARFIDLGLGEHADAVGKVILALTS
jgi:tetratricopeptide (TPR) repeat protein